MPCAEGERSAYYRTHAKRSLANRVAYLRATDCYRKMRDIMRQRPDDYDQSFETEFAALIDKLDPPVVP
jgi:hypothetical protein